MLELLDFYAGWCGPCQTMKPIFEEVAREFTGKVVCRKVNVDEGTEETEKYGVMNIPVFVMLKDGVEISKKTGGMSKAALVEWILEIINNQAPITKK